MVDVSARGREVITVLGAMLIIIVAFAQATRMMGEAWQSRDLVFNVAYLVTGSIGVNIDVAVVFPAGVVGAWLVLFMLDGHKTVQGLVLLFVAVPAFLWTLSRRGEWIETVDWLGYWWAFLAGAFIGLVSGGFGSKRANRWDLRRFPTASKALYAVVSVTALVAFAEFHLTYASPILWNLQTGQVTTQAVGPVSVRGESLLVNTVSVVALVVVFNVFTKYSDSTTMLVLGPDTAGTAKANLVGGLYNHAQGHDAYRGVQPIADADPIGAQQLNDATEARSRADLPEDIESTAFKFRRGGPLNRRTVVRVDSQRPPGRTQVTRLEDRVGKRRTVVGRGIQYLSRGARLLLPGWLRDGLRSNADQFLTRIDRANTLLLVVSFDDLVDRDRYEAGTYQSLSDVVDDTAECLHVYDRLCAMYRDVPGHEVCVVVTGAVEIREMLMAAENGADGPIVFHADEFREDVADLIGVDHCTVLPFDRRFDEQEGEKIKGADAVLRSV
ncbi:sulfite exporter TauE/SafE family protein [Haloplanus sp.]|uniref:sulfite exporter TauE/SafE family protein n=1 Tax=Haloplanus sp. TaxID=1961696 RepID=UPI00260F749A|nr:sulfite exporter TauE/SafE family protein [Haloplanus sp.]